MCSPTSLPLPFTLWEILARLAAVLPAPPLTHAQVTLMRRDNVVGPAALSLKDLGIDATALETILADYAF